MHCCPACRSKQVIVADTFTSISNSYLGPTAWSSQRSLVLAAPLAWLVLLMCFPRHLASPGARVSVAAVIGLSSTLPQRCCSAGLPDGAQPVQTAGAGIDSSSTWTSRHRAADQHCGVWLQLPRECGGGVCTSWSTDPHRAHSAPLPATVVLPAAARAAWQQAELGPDACGLRRPSRSVLLGHAPVVEAL